MKKTIITTAILLTGFFGFSQSGQLAIAEKVNLKTDSLKQDSVLTTRIATEVYQFAREKNLGVKDFELLGNILQAYLEDKNKKRK